MYDPDRWLGLLPVSLHSCLVQVAKRKHGMKRVLCKLQQRLEGQDDFSVCSTAPAQSPPSTLGQGQALGCMLGFAAGHPALVPCTRCKAQTLHAAVFCTTSVVKT